VCDGVEIPAVKRLYKKLPTHDECLSERNTVEVQDKGVIQMDALQIGDRVRVAGGRFSKVYSFGHLSMNPAATVEYLQITTNASSSTPPIEITRDHMLFVVGAAGDFPVTRLTQRAVTAAKVSTGDLLVVASGEFVSVVQIKTVFRRGAFAPFTESGDLIVSGVLTSSYVSLQPNSEDRLTIGGTIVEIPVSMQWLAHMATTPRRVVCFFQWKWCEQERRDANGIALWLNSPLRIAKWYVDHDVEVWVVLVTGIFSAMIAMGMWKGRHGRKRVD